MCQRAGPTGGGEGGGLNEILGAFVSGPLAIPLGVLAAVKLGLNVVNSQERKLIKLSDAIHHTTQTQGGRFLDEDRFQAEADLQELRFHFAKK